MCLKMHNNLKNTKTNHYNIYLKARCWGHMTLILAGRSEFEVSLVYTDPVSKIKHELQN